MTDQLARLQAALAGRYTIEQALGRGGMATVFLARDLKHGRPIALKLLRPELASALGPGRFLREIEIAARLTHPNILPLHDSGEADGFLYYVMPYVEGESLRSRLAREGPLPLDQAVEIAREVADGLGYAHAHGVVHRDIKPENILLESGHAVVADFGIARAVTAAAGDSLTETGIAVGSPAYMSPEQAGAEASIDGRSDIYALACVLYEMLAGEPPFTGPTPRAVAAKHLRQSVPSVRVTRPGVPSDVDQVIRTALAKAPADRFPDAARFAAALAACAAPPKRRLALPRRWPGVVLAAALGLAAGRWAWGRWGGAASLPVAATRLDPTHVAVLYFEDLSEGRTLRHVAGGLTEDLIDQLGQVDGLRVISSSGVAAYRERSVPLDSIARALGVGTIVTGSVGRSAGRLRVSVRLIDAANGDQLRSQTLERPWGDLFALRDAAAQQVSRFLREELGQEVQLRQRRAATKSVAAWELLQRAQRQWEDARALSAAGDQGGADGLLATGDSLLARAEAYDPAWVEPVLLRGWLAAERAGLLGTGSRPPRPFWIRIALEHASRALAMRPGYPPALELRGTLDLRRWLFGAGGDTTAIAAAERDLRAAVVPANPSAARAWSTLSLLLQVRGKLTESNIAAERAYHADAFLRDAAEIVFRLYYTSSDLDRQADALRWCSEGHARFPEDWRFTYCQLAMQLWPGGERPDVDRAWRLVGELERLTPVADRATYTPRWHLVVAGVLARAGRADSARAVIARSRAAAPRDPEMDYNEAVARTLLGERDRVIELLRNYLRVTPQVRDYLGADPVFRTLRDDPRFKALVTAP